MIGEYFGPPPEVDRAAVCELIDREVVQDGAGGTKLTFDDLAGHPLVRPIVQAAEQLVASHWCEPELPVRAWGIRISAGVQIPPHDHKGQRFTCVYYLTDGVDLVVEDEPVHVWPGRLITFPGTALHWTERHDGHDRYSIAMAFG